MKINVYKSVNDIPINEENFIVFNIDLAYKDISTITDIPAIKYALKKLLCSDIDINNV